MNGTLRRFYRFLLCAALFAFAASAPAQEKPKKKAEPKPIKVPDSVLFERDVQYGSAGDRALQLDVIRPKAERDKPRPVVVWIHGGGWSGGNKSSGLGLLLPYAAGGEYVCFSVGYRLSGEAIWPAQVHDCKAAIRWIKANAKKYNIDPKRIGVWGGSAGGHLVSLLGTSSDIKELEGQNGSADQETRVACVADFCGPSDFLNFFSQPRSKNASGAITGLFGGTVEEKKAEATIASPITHVTRDDPPFLIVHGTEDNIVPFAQAETFYQALKKAGCDATFVKMDGGGHGIGGREISARVNAFFDKHLLGKEVEVSDKAIKVAVDLKKEKVTKAEIEVVEAQMKLLTQAIQLFHFQCRRLPAKLDELVAEPADLADKWRGPYAEATHIEKDVWGNAFTYQVNAKEKSFTLTSKGPPGGAPIVVTKKL